MSEHSLKRRKPPRDRAAYSSETWYRLRDYVLTRDARICCNCSWPGSRVVHHLTMEFGVICPPEFLVVMCTPCHLARHELSASANIPIRDHYEVYKANKGFQLLAQPEPGCRGEWIGKDRFRYWGRRGTPLCLADPPLLKSSADWDRILVDAHQRYRARPASAKYHLTFCSADEEESAWARYYRWGTSQHYTQPHVEGGDNRHVR